MMFLSPAMLAMRCSAHRSVDDDETINTVGAVSAFFTSLTSRVAGTTTATTTAAAAALAVASSSTVTARGDACIGVESSSVSTCTADASGDSLHRPAAVH